MKSIMEGRIAPPFEHKFLARRHLLLGAALLSALGVGACRQGGEAAGPWPKAPVILISIDTLRADRLPTYGFSGVATPALDAFAADSLVFEEAYTSAPLTLPAHASIFTGLHPYAHGVRDNIGFRLDTEAFPTLAQFLSGHGYATGAAVSAYVLRKEAGLGGAFDHYEDGIVVDNPEAMGEVQRVGTETTAAARRWLEGLGDAPPFFFLHLFEPHSPYRPPEPFRSRYAASPYDGEIAAVDEIVGRFLNFLRDRDLYERALIILLSDHGEGLGDHGEPEHGILLYRETIRVPLLVKLPGQAQAGGRVAAPVELVDVFPTVAEVLGLETPVGLAGRSLLTPASEDVAEAGSGSPENLGGAYSESYYARYHLGWSELRSVTDGRYHFIEAPTPELYDMSSDPRESRNVLEQERRPFRRLQAALAEHGAAGDAPAPQTVDPEEAARLAALGYLTAPAAAADGPRPDPKEVLPALGEISAAAELARAGNHEEAASRLQGLVERFPGMLDARVQLATSLKALGRPEEALDQYRAALEEVPSASDALLMKIAETYLGMGRLPEAQEHAQALTETLPAEAWPILGRVALARGDAAAAVTALRRGLAAAGGSRPELEVLLARTQITADQVPEALATLEGLRDRLSVAERSLPPGAEFLRGDALGRLGRLEEAGSAFRAEIAQFPAHSQAYASLAVIYASLRRFSEIEPLLESMVAARPQREVYLLAAETAARLGDTTGAESWRRRAPAVSSKPGP